VRRWQVRDAGDADAIKKLVAVRFFSKQTGFEETVRRRNANPNERVQRVMCRKCASCARVQAHACVRACAAACPERTSAKSGLNVHWARVCKRVRACVRGRVRPTEAIASSKAGGAVCQMAYNGQHATCHVACTRGGRWVGGQVSGEFKNGGIVCLSPPCKLRGMLLVEIALNRRHFTRTVRAVPRVHGRGRRLGWACSGALSGRVRRVRHWRCALLCSLHARTHARTHAQWHAGFGRGRIREYGRANYGRE
jgi:hypothetical protein